MNNDCDPRRRECRQGRQGEEIYYWRERYRRVLEESLDRLDEYLKKLIRQRNHRQHD